MKTITPGYTKNLTDPVSTVVGAGAAVLTGGQSLTVQAGAAGVTGGTTAGVLVLGC